MIQKTPRDLAEKREEYVNEYASLSDELSEILTDKAIRWSVFRSQSTSDKQASKKWDATNAGIREMQIHLKMKALDKQIASIASMIRVLEGESRNSY